MISIILALIIIELGLSVFLVIEERKENKKKICNESCDPVLTSKYNKMFNIPNTFLGLLFFSALILFEFINFKIEYVLVSSMWVLASLSNIRLIYAQKYLIKHYCKFCITLSILTFISTILYFTIR